MPSGKHVGFSDQEPLETTYTYNSNYSSKQDELNHEDISTAAFQSLKSESFANSDATINDSEREAVAVERLSMRLLSVPDDDEEEADRILRESLHDLMTPEFEIAASRRKSIRAEKQAGGRFTTMVALLLLGGIAFLAVLIYVGAKVIGPPSQPLGPYRLVERQVSWDVLVALFNVEFLHPV